MTEEELEQKAEDYARYTRIKDDKTYRSFDDECISEVQDYEGNYIYLHNRIEKAYKDGYIQGQKDKLTEKEKLELKDLLNRSNIRLAEEQIKNNELKEEIKLIESVTDANADKVEELKTQIKKMKCCENCKWYNNRKHHPFLNAELKCNFLPYEEELKCMKDKNKWELAE